MKTFTDYLFMNTRNEREFVNITREVVVAVTKGELDGRRKKRVLVKVIGV